MLPYGAKASLFVFRPSGARTFQHLPAGNSHLDPSAACNLLQRCCEVVLSGYNVVASAFLLDQAPLYLTQPTDLSTSLQS